REILEYLEFSFAVDSLSGSLAPPTMLITTDQLTQLYNAGLVSNATGPGPTGDGVFFINGVPTRQQQINVGASETIAPFPHFDTWQGKGHQSALQSDRSAHHNRTIY